MNEQWLVKITQSNGFKTEEIKITLENKESVARLLITFKSKRGYKIIGFESTLQTSLF